MPWRRNISRCVLHARGRIGGGCYIYFFQGTEDQIKMCESVLKITRSFTNKMCQFQEKGLQETMSLTCQEVAGDAWLGVHSGYSRAIPGLSAPKGTIYPAGASVKRPHRGCGSFGLSHCYGHFPPNALRGGK